MKYQDHKNVKNILPELVTLFLLIPLAFVLLQVAQKEPRNHAQEEVNSNPAENNETIQAAPTRTPPANTPNNGAVKSAVGSKIKESVRLAISAPEARKKCAVPVADSNTVLEIMEKAKKICDLTYEGKDYGGELGFFVSSIEGVANQPQKDTYWGLYINGKYSNLGVSRAEVYAGNTIEWRMEKKIKEKEY